MPKAETPEMTNAFISKADLSCAEEIRYRAFYESCSLSEVLLGSRLMKIDAFAFANCRCLKEISIPENRHLKISPGAFWKTPLQKVEFGKRTDFEGIEDNTLLIAANRCPVCKREAVMQLQGMQCPSCALFFSWEELDGFKDLETTGRTVTGYLGSWSACEIPDGMKRIEKKAFCDSSITCITIPESIEEIGPAAFMDCDYMAAVSVSCKLNRIENHLFTGTPGGVNTFWYFEEAEYVGESAFAGNVSFDDTLSTGNHIRVIGEGAFEECMGLEHLDISKGLAVLGDGAFRKTSLETVTLADSVRIIRAECFSQCTSLKEVVLQEGLLKIEKKAFEDCASLKRISFPDSLLSIGEGAFKGCASLKQVTLPAALKNVDFSEVFESDVVIVYR